MLLFILILKQVQSFEVNFSKIEIITSHITQRYLLADKLIFWNDVIIIGANSFDSMKGLKEVFIWKHTMAIDDGAFRNCANLKVVTFGEKIAKIGDLAFANCISLENLHFPNSLIEIGKFAFGSCRQLKAIIFGDGPSLFKIADMAFCYCELIEQIIIPNSVRTIGISAFKKCRNLKFFVFGTKVSSVENNTFSGCINLLEIEIPHRAISIGYHSFFKCRNLSRISIGKSVKNIDPLAFINCYSLEIIFVNEKNIYYSNYNDDGILYNKKTSKIIRFPEGKRREIFIFHRNVISVERNAFKNCVHLNYIQMSLKVERIKAYAFHGCKGIKGFTLPKSVILVDVGAFQGCTSMNLLFIGSGVEEIREHAFSECISLKCVYYFGDNEPFVNYNAFVGVNILVIVKNEYQSNKFGNLNVFRGSEYDDCIAIMTYISIYKKPSQSDWELESSSRKSQ